MKMPGCLDVLAWALQVNLYTPSTTEVESSAVDRGLWTCPAGLHGRGLGSGTVPC